MTDKTKLDEAATLNVSTEQDGMTANTTFTADDLVGLAALLKNAGIESAQFNGAATLTVDAANEGGTVSTMIQSPDLRAIMQLMEPEFQMAGDMMASMDDMGSDMEPEMVDAPMPAEVPMDAPVEPVEGPMDDAGAVDATVDADGNLTLVDPEMDMEPASDVELEDDIEEEADYDYRDHDVHPHAYSGKGSKDIVQPETKAVPARSGDNPLAEGPFDNKRGEFSDTEQGAIDFMKFMSSHNMDGATARPDPVVDGVWLVSHQGGKSIVYLNDMDFEDIDEEVKPKSFADYVQEASARNHVEPQVKSYTVESLLTDFNKRK